MNATRDRADIPVRLLDSHIFAEATECIVVMRRPAQILAIKIGRQPQSHIWRELEPGREHADNGEDRIINF